MTNFFNLKPFENKAEMPNLESGVDHAKLNHLLGYLRDINKADSHVGFNLCREVNKRAVELLQQNGSNAHYLYCRNYSGITRSDIGVEHFVGVVELNDRSSVWFDGTTDQLKKDIDVQRPIHIEQVSSKEEAKYEVADKLGGNWE